MPHRKSKHGMQMGRGMVYRDTEGDQFAGGRNRSTCSPGYHSTATWMSAFPLILPGCPDPQDQLREVTGWEGCSLQCSLASLRLECTVHGPSAGPGRTG